MYLLIFIFLVFLVVQIVLGIAGWNLRRNLPHKYSYALGSQIQLTDILEKYMRKYKHLHLKASSKIQDVVHIHKDILFINKKHIYSKDLYSNVYLLYQLKLFKTHQQFLNRLFIAQNLLFVLEFIILFAGISLTVNSWGEILIMVAIAIQLSLFISSMLGYLKFDDIVEPTLKESKKLLHLDDVEEARAEALLNEFKYSLWEYPFDIIWKILQFLKF